MRKTVITVFAALLFILTQTSNADRIDLASLLNDMLDRSKIAEFPDPPFLCKQTSSYNRLSTGTKPGDENWFANDDSSFFYGSDERDGRTEWIMADVEGPGAVVRWWITQYKYDGTIRIYLDNSEKPIFEGKGDELLGGKTITGPPLSAFRAWGRNLYLPIPFNKHCKITYDGANKEKTGKFADCLYYNINYLQYPKHTNVKTLTIADTQTNSELIDKVQRQLLEPQNNQLDIAKKIKGQKKILSPNQSITCNIDGARAICSLRVKITADDIEQAMRSTVISATFDGKQRVWAPVGEFFGTGPGINPFKGWWRQVQSDGWMNCWWPMPFENNASITITNHGTTDVTAQLDDIAVADWPWTERTMYFHSTWRSDDKIAVFGGDKSKMQDFNYATIKGKGVYVGDTLSLFNRPKKGPIGPWWGEGDEKIVVDGEPFPSHFGTGTEDYYGYAWGVSDRFEAPFHAQTDGTGNKGPGRTTNTRTRVLDKIPFNTSLTLDMELSHWQTTNIDYASTSYWYAFDDAQNNGQTSHEKVRSKIGRIAE
jgi:hypothetical protein